MTTIILTLLLGFAAPQGSGVVRVEVDSDTLLLGDLIPLSDTDPRGTVSLGAAPAPGLARRLNDYEIEGKLRTASLPADGLRLPSAILVTRASATLDVGQVREVVRNEFELRFPGARIDLLELTIPANQVATGPIDVSATLPGNFRPDGPISVRVDARSNGFSRSIFVRTRVAIETLQPVLTRDIESQLPVNQSDVRWQMTPLTSTVTSVASIDTLEGLVAKRDLKAGQVLTDRMLYSPLLIRRGEAVTVAARVGNISVSALMKARDAGRYGDTIVVEHLNGEGRTSARVTGPGTVEAIVMGR